MFYETDLIIFSIFPLKRSSVKLYWTGPWPRESFQIYEIAEVRLELKVESSWRKKMKHPELDLFEEVFINFWNAAAQVDQKVILVLRSFSIIWLFFCEKRPWLVKQ